MKLFSSKPTASSPTQGPSAKVDRRGLVLGAGVAGVAAVAAHALHRGALEVPVAAAVKPASVQGEGYQLTEHVRRYYETTKA